MSYMYTHLYIYAHTHCLHLSKTLLGTGNCMILSLMPTTKSTLTGSSLSGFCMEQEYRLGLGHSPVSYIPTHFEATEGFTNWITKTLL